VPVRQCFIYKAPGHAVFIECLIDVRLFKFPGAAENFYEQKLLDREGLWRRRYDRRLSVKRLLQALVHQLGIRLNRHGNTHPNFVICFNRIIILNFRMA
jgi:hypothetical protein